MKPLKITFSLIIVLFACNRHPADEIRTVFQPAYNDTKTITTKIYNNMQGAGGVAFSNLYPSFRLLLLNSDTTFTYYQSNGAALTGKWRFVKDSVELAPYAGNKNYISYRVAFSALAANTKVVFIVSDKAGKPIENFIIQPFDKLPLYNYSHDGDLVVDKTSKNKLPGFPDNFSTDSTGVVKLNKQIADSLDFTKLYPLTGKRYRIGTSRLPDTVRLTINANAMLFENYRQPFKVLADLPTAMFIIRGNRFIIPFD